MRHFMILGAAASAGLLLAAASASATVTFDWATVGNPGNAADTRFDATGYGTVGYNYSISKKEVTNAQYVEFLNAVDAGDIDGLYDPNMSSDPNVAGIIRSGTTGNYSYAAKSGRGNQPVVYVSWNDAARFVNWLSNGQKTGSAGAASVESGVYDMTQTNPTRAANAQVFLPTENEWYKAAYYDPTLNSGAGGYYTYATKSNTVPTSEAPVGGNNSANYYDNGYPVANATTGFLSDAGAYTDSTSYYGTFDQSGNVWEWNETLLPGPDRGLRGGSWVNESYALPASYRLHDVPTYEDYDLGFRVASLPEPGSCMIVLGLAGAALIRRRHST